MVNTKILFLKPVQHSPAVVVGTVTTSWPQNSQQRPIQTGSVSQKVLSVLFLSLHTASAKVLPVHGARVGGAVVGAAIMMKNHNRATTRACA